MKHFSITTLGCKVNQCESASLESQLQDAGYRKSSIQAACDLVVINTCTVTSKAAMQSRQAIRQAIRNHPGARIVVTGCYAQTAPEEIRSIDQVDLIVGHQDKSNIVPLLDTVEPRDASPKVIRSSIKTASTFSPLASVAPDARTRAFLKIQDGCNAFCTYCIVPHARGRSRSMPWKDVGDHIAQLSARGFQEVVLTGIHLGAFGKDLVPPKSLADLLAWISSQKRPPRIRISSVEPTEVDASLMKVVQAAENVVCPHFHIPLQSGDNTILKRMGRTYSRDQFADIINHIRTTIPHAAIGVDILAGFPGETDAAFEQTYDLIERLPISYLHVFPFSARKGTPAATYDHQIPQPIAKARCRRLRQLGDVKKAQFAHANVGKRLHVLIETAQDSAYAAAKGTSENYLTVVVPEEDLQENTIVPVRIEEVLDGGVVKGRFVD